MRELLISPAFSHRRSVRFETPIALAAVAADAGELGIDEEEGVMAGEFAIFFIDSSASFAIRFTPLESLDACNFPETIQRRIVRRETPSVAAA